MSRTLADIAEAMRDIDFAMLVTHGPDGALAARPMSNNREVAFDGDSFYFTWADSLMVADISRDSGVTLTFQGKAGLLGMRPFFVAVEGRAEIVRDRAQFAEHWNDELDRWFKQGIDTPNLAMIHVHAGRLSWWDGDEDGTLELADSAIASG